MEFRTKTILNPPLTRAPFSIASTAWSTISFRKVSSTRTFLKKRDVVRDTPKRLVLRAFGGRSQDVGARHMLDLGLEETGMPPFLIPELWEYGLGNRFGFVVLPEWRRSRNGSSTATSEFIRG